MIRRNKERDHGSAVRSTTHAMVRVSDAKQFHLTILIFCLCCARCFRSKYILPSPIIKKKDNREKKDLLVNG